MRGTRSEAREDSPDAGLGAVTIAVVLSHAGSIAAATAVMFIHWVGAGATGAIFIR